MSTTASCAWTAAVTSGNFVTLLSGSPTGDIGSGRAQFEVSENAGATRIAVPAPNRLQRWHAKRH